MFPPTHNTHTTLGTAQRMFIPGKTQQPGIMEERNDETSAIIMDMEILILETEARTFQSHINSYCLISYVLPSQTTTFPTEGAQQSIGHVQPNDDFLCAS